MKTETIGNDERGDGVVRVRANFSRDDLRLKGTPFGLVVELKGCSTGGEAGAPALPRTSIHIAVPEGTWPGSLDVKAAQVIPLTDKATLVAPAQPPRAGEERSGDAHETRKRDEKRHAEEKHRQPDRHCAPPPTSDDDQEDIEFEGFPAPPIVPPDPALYERAAKQPVSRITSIDHLGFNPVMRVELRPVRYAADGRLELVTEFEIALAYGPKPEPLPPERLKALLEENGVRDVDTARLMPLPEPKVVSRGQATRLNDLAKALVVNPGIIGKWNDRFPYLELPAEYLIITDNQTWNADTIAPTGTVAGDMVGAFRRLADWKRSRGLTAKVATVTDIVGGRYGNFRSGSRDLPEVIRRFLKWAYERWGVAWVLIGGDVGVVPARNVAGGVEGHMDVQATDPPPNNTSFWTGSFLKMNVQGPGTWWPGSWDRILTNATTGQPIPFDSTGASAGGSLGWYYTTSDTYATRATMPTQYVRVNGPAGVVNGRMQWLYEWNRIPTDFYYASLQSYAIAYLEIDIWFLKIRIPYVYVPAHDWDALDNGLYGQFVNGQDVDGVVWRTDVSVGRAPVSSLTEANTFVDKVIAYERFRASDGSWLNSDWPRRLVFAASNWGDPVQISPTFANPPGDNAFRNLGAYTLVKLANAPGSFDFQLIADISDSDRRELAFNIGGGSGPGWYYARSATDLSPSQIDINLLFIHISFPVPSQWIVVHGTAQELSPRYYFLDWTGQDGSMADEEQLRDQLRTEIPGWDQVSRYYKDETDLTPVQAGAAPVQHLTTTRVRDALNAGPHIVSLSGHGAPWGCCGADSGMAATLTNGPYAFIGYADSCLTNQYEGEDAFSEELLKNPNGGAVAYVGNSRFSWIGLGDDHQRSFFHRLVSTRHIGLANDMRIFALDMTYWHAYARWCVHALNLLGDPEMQVWRGRHRFLGIDVFWNGDRRIPLVVKLKPRRPKPGEPVERFEDIVVHLRQGDFERIERADATGTATFDVQQAAAGKLTLTVSGPEAVPVIEELEVLGPVWVAGKVACVSHRHDARDETFITLDTGDGRRTFTAKGGTGDYALIVNAATEAYLAHTPLELLVETAREGAAVERYRLCER
jgi:hypothetical protein